VAFFFVVVVFGAFECEIGKIKISLHPCRTVGIAVGKSIVGRLFALPTIFFGEPAGKTKHHLGP